MFYLPFVTDVFIYSVTISNIVVVVIESAFFNAVTYTDASFSNTIWSHDMSESLLQIYIGTSLTMLHEWLVCLLT